MARPANMVGGRSALALVGWLGLVGAIAAGLGCNKKDKQAPPPAASPPATTAPAGKPPEAKAAADDGKLHCAQFLTKDDLAAIGLTRDPTPDEQSPGPFVMCNYGGATAMIWSGDAWSTVVGSMKANKIAPEDGPRIGEQTVWTSMSDNHIVGFQPANKKYTATVTGGDKARNEKVARALLARFEKM